jgi:eukaryotic-like serine/threonine-protein kinase
MSAMPSSMPSERQRLPPLVFGPFTFDTQSRLLRREGREIALPPRVLGVLELLLQRAGDVVSRQELIDAVWKDAFVTDTSLAEAVSVLRQGLGDDPQAPTYIQTLHRRGYRFVAPVAAGAIARNGEPRRDDAQASGEARVSPSIGGQLVPWAAAVICALIAITAVWQLTTKRQDFTPPAARFEITAAPAARFDTSAPALAISTDGTQLAWSGCDDSGCRLYHRPLDRLEAAAVTGSDDAHAPFFSPDGRWIAFFAGGRLKKVAIAGGAPVTIADAPSILGGVWIDREIVFAGSPAGGLMRVSEDGGDPRVLTRPREAAGEVRHSWPSLVPGQRMLLFTIDAVPGDGAPGVMGVLSLDAVGSSPREVTSWRTPASGVDLVRAAGPDVIVLSRGGELQAMAFDAARQAAGGAPRAVAGAVSVAGGRAQFALSATGALTYGSAEDAARAGLSWRSSAGSQTAPDEIRPLRDAALTSDGTRLAGVQVEGSRSDIWIADVQRGAATRLSHSGINAAPVWAANGRTVYFAARSDGPFEIWSRDADGVQPAARLFATSRHAIPRSASPDGTMLVFMQTAENTRADLWALPLNGGAPRPLVQGPFDETEAAFSPDSNLLAFQSSETGRWEIYVQRIADGRRLVVSTEGGEHPVWTKDGLYFQSRDRLMRATVASNGNDLRVGAVDAVCGLRDATLRGIAPDGRALVDVSDASPSPSPARAIVTLEWLREVRTLLGPPSAALPR